MMKKELNILICLLLTTLTAYVQPVTATVDRTKILIGEKIQLQLKGTFEKTGNVSWFTIDTIPHFEIMERQKVDSQQNQNTLTLTQIFILTSWDSGRWQIPSLQLGSSGTQPISITVGYTPFDVKKPYNDIKDIVEVKKPEQSTWYWYLIGAVLLIVLFLLFFPSGKKQENAVEEIDWNAYKKAMLQLEKIQEENWADKNVKEYYTQLIHVFRQYVQARKGIHSFSKTTDDLVIQLLQLKMPATVHSKLLQTLRLSDLVKFAKYVPTESENSESFNNIVNSIRIIEQGNAV